MHCLNLIFFYISRRGARAFCKLHVGWCQILIFMGFQAYIFLRFGIRFAQIMPAISLSQCFFRVSYSAEGTQDGLRMLDLDLIIPLFPFIWAPNLWGIWSKATHLNKLCDWESSPFSLFRISGLLNFCVSQVVVPSSNQKHNNDSPPSPRTVRFSLWEFCQFVSWIHLILSS